MNENMNTEQIIYKFRYWMARKLDSFSYQILEWRIKLENKNYWNEHNPNFRK